LAIPQNILGTKCLHILLRKFPPKIEPSKEGLMEVKCSPEAI
jgi:hypothetical protein